MFSYSTNCMGPVNKDWFEKRGIDPDQEHWAGGRIDIDGLNEREFYAGKHEYSLPIMDGLSWNLFSDWLENYETEDLKTFEQLVNEFETDTDHYIRWASDVFRDIE